MIADLLAIETIRRVIAQYGQLLDDGCYDAWGDLFTADASFWSVPGAHLPGGQAVAKLEGRAAIVAGVSQAQRTLRREGAVLHFGGNPVIDVRAGTADAWWDFMIVHALATGNIVLFAGRYHTELVEQERWRFRRRVSVQLGHQPPAGVPTTPASAT